MISVADVPVHEDASSSMSLEEAIYSRRAVRAYSSEPVSDAVIRKLIDAAVHAPSALDRQPWHFTVVRDSQLLNSISAEARRHILESKIDRPLPHPIHERLTEGFDIFYGAPALILISSLSPAWAEENCALAAQNLMLMACSHGLGSCWVGLAQAWLATPAGKALLALPADCQPVAPIVVGVPIQQPPPVVRREPPIRWL